MGSTIEITHEGEWYVIRDTETGVTTQGRTKIEALLMLADALSAYEDSDEDLLALAEDIFTLDEEQIEFLEELGYDVE